MFSMNKVSDLHTKKKCFTVRTTNHWNGFPRDMVESSSWEVFKKADGQGTRSSHQGSLSHERLDRVIFLRSLPIWAVLWFCEIP